jgi:bacillithiol system protein YtxJ
MEVKMIKDLKANSDFNDIIELSHEKPVFLLKHSTACPISAGVWGAFQRFAEKVEGVECRRVLIRENRELSGLITNRTGIKHQSPQMILFHKGQPVWNASHRGITEDSFKAALEELE